jgi:rifampin ADP-ribosylating transferase
MDISFDPNNQIIKRCLQGIGLEESGNPAEASSIFFEAWRESKNDFERFISAYFVARHQKNISDKLNWLETSLKFALRLNDGSVKSAFPTLYMNIAKCYEELHDLEKAKQNEELSNSYKIPPTDTGPFYHGTKADLQVGDLLLPKMESNYKPDLNMNHIYFTALINGAGLAAALAKGVGRERVYVVEPTGVFENDPNVTDKKFPGNLTRSYRSHEPLRIVGEVTEWFRLTPDERRKWDEKLADNKGEIID